MADERRKSDRRKVFKGGTIVFNDEGSSIGCTIRSISEGGARLQVETVAGIPSEFTLLRDDGAPPRRCFVMWRDATFLGVRFLQRRLGDETEPS